MPGAVELSEVQPGDAQEVRLLMARVIRVSVTHDRELLAETIANVFQNVDAWLADPARCVHYLARIDGRIVGVVLVKEFWNLCSLFVDPALHGQGIGRALLEAACNACTGRSPKGAIFLNAAPNAIGFYRRLGFVERESARELPAGFLAMKRAL